MADPIVAGEYGKAAFDAVGPLLLIGWAEVGPDLLRALTAASQATGATPDDVKPAQALCRRTDRYGTGGAGIVQGRREARWRFGGQAEQSASFQDG